MITFSICFILLIVAYFLYGKYLERVIGIDPNHPTPAKTHYDGVDYLPLPQWKTFLIQLLNIAGLGPIFGALLGAMYGPVAFLWITFGGILIGGLHDYASGMISMKKEGQSLPELVGHYLRNGMKQSMRIITLLLMVLVGAVFLVGPAGILEGMTPWSKSIWIWIILIYYILATLLPIDKIIGRIYPIFGAALFFMALGILYVLIFGDCTIPELSADNWRNFKSDAAEFPIFPTLFITIACGAISGFHATQSPLMARCLTNEKQGKPVFFGAMIAESLIALIWAAAGCALYTITDGKMVGLAEALAAGQSAAIYDVCAKTMGGVGIALAMIGVVICPITSGDTAFRSARLTLADWFKIDQDSYANRLKLCVPVLGVGAFLGIGNALGFINYTVIWRYFSWTNQTLAMIVLWAASMYLFKEKKNYWITAVPATFMSAVSCTYFVLAPECLGKMINTYADGKLVAYNTAVAYPIGIIFAIAMLALFIHATKKHTASQKA